MRNAGTRSPDPNPTVRTLTLVLGASMLLVSAASGCAAGYQPYATTTLATPVVQAEVSAPGIDAQVQLAPQPSVVVQPDLLTLTPDVQVVAAYDEPVFYTGGFYWREQNGGWYRSHSHDTGWSSSSDVPYSVRSIENRGSYRNYRPSGYQPRASYADHRYQRPTYDRGYQPRPSGGYDRPSGGYNQPTGYNRPQTQRPAYGGNNDGNGYQPRSQDNDNRYNPRPGYNQNSGYSSPRPSSGYTSGRPSSGYTSGRPASGYTSGRPASGYTSGRPASGYTSARPASGYTSDRPASGYTSDRPASGYNQPRPASGYNQPRPSSGYNQSSQGYQPRPSSGYSNGRAPGYQPRPSQSSYESGRAPGYQPRPSQSSYNRPSNSGSSYKRQPTSTSRRR